jgi:Fe-S-cluster containining protein
VTRERLTPEQRIAALEEIYAALPDVPCKRLCFESCSFIGTFRVERERMRAAGVEPPRMEEVPCRHLMFNGECGAHELRPVICRLYGATEELECPFGCRAEHPLSKQEAFRVMELVDRVLPFPRRQRDGKRGADPLIPAKAELILRKLKTDGKLRSSG